MYIESPQAIKKAEIIIGIPSYNEAERIGFVTEQICLGGQRYFPDKKVVIVNIDGHSTDNTKEVFFSVHSDIPKIYIAPDKKVRGKGYGLYELFLLIRKFQAKAGLTFDADLKSIQPDWVKKMAEPILEGYDFAAPYYTRFENDATITNHLVYPIVYGLLAWDMRQPIGGDFAFSDKMVDIWLRGKWHRSTYGFGVDIFMSLNALLHQVKVCQVNLGSKIHKTTGIGGLSSMFSQVSQSLFQLILSNLDKIKTRQSVERIVILEGSEIPFLADIQTESEHFQELFLKQFPLCYPSLKKIISSSLYRDLSTFCHSQQTGIDLFLWTRLVYELLAAYGSGQEQDEIIRALDCLYFGRVADFFARTKAFSPEETEKEIIHQAEYFFQNRDYFLTKFD